VYERWYDEVNIEYIDWLYTTHYNQTDLTSGAGIA
jgi:hypothetical protein